MDTGGAQESTKLLGAPNLTLAPLANFVPPRHCMDLKVKGHCLMNYSQHTHLKTVTFAILIITSCGCDMPVLYDRLWEYE